MHLTRGVFIFYFYVNVKCPKDFDTAIHGQREKLFPGKEISRRRFHCFKADASADCVSIISSRSRIFLLIPKEDRL